MTTATGTVNSMEEIDAFLERLLVSDPEVVGVYAPVFHRLRSLAPVHRFGNVVFVSRYDDVHAVLTNPGSFSNDASRKGARAAIARGRIGSDDGLRAFDGVMQWEANLLTRKDGADHRRLRAIAMRGFTPSRIAALVDVNNQYANDLVDAVAGADVVDLTEVAYELPLRVISYVLGVPEADWPLIRRWSAAITRNRHGMEEGPLIAAYAAWQEFAEYSRGLAESQRHGDAGTGVVAALLDAEGDKLNDDELVSMLVVLITGAHETTSNLLSIGLWELLRSPGAWQRLAHEGVPANVPEELLRIVSPTQWISRRVVHRTELRGVTLEEDETLLVVLSAANRDPAVFTEPDRIDLDRANAGRHLALGFGPHYCLGTALARVEVRAFLETLARRYPSLSLATDTVEWHGAAQLRRLRELPARLGAPA